MKKSRGLSEEDARLWDLAIRDAIPLAARRPHRGDARPRRPAHPRPIEPPPRIIPSDGAAALFPPPSLKLDGATERRLRRGALEIEASLDLHGETEARAYHRLRRFLEGAAAHDARFVLVITGKGGRRTGEDALDGPRPKGRGVLRRAVPLWLGEPPLVSLVVGFRPAHQRHGGDGALYVRLRKRRSTTR